MAGNFNKVMLMGNITRDPELRFLPSNMPVCTIGLAVNERWKDRNSGEQRESTTFVDCEAFGRTAELINQYFAKGRPIFLEGRLRLDQWQDREGNNRSKLKVVVENFQFVDSRADAEGGRGGGGGGGGGGREHDRGPRQGGRGGEGGGGGGGGRSREDVGGGTYSNGNQGGDHVPVSEDDIPF